MVGSALAERCPPRLAPNIEPHAHGVILAAAHAHPWSARTNADGVRYVEAEDDPQDEAPQGDLKHSARPNTVRREGCGPTTRPGQKGQHTQTPGDGQAGRPRRPRPGFR